MSQPKVGSLSVLGMRRLKDLLSWNGDLFFNVRRGADKQRQLVNVTESGKMLGTSLELSSAHSPLRTERSTSWAQG